MRRGEISLGTCIEKLEYAIDKIDSATTLEEAQDVLSDLHEVYEALDARKDEISDAISTIKENLG